MKVIIMLSALIAGTLLFASPSLACDSCGCKDGGKHDGGHGMKHDGDHNWKHDGDHNWKHDGDHNWKHDDGHRGDRHGRHHGNKHEGHHGGHGDCYGGWSMGHGVGPSRFSQETGEWLGNYPHGHHHGNAHEHFHGHAHGNMHGNVHGNMHGNVHGNWQGDWNGMGMEIFTMEKTMHVATLHGMLDENLPALYMQLMEEVAAQGLIGPDTHVGAIVPNAISADDMSQIQVWPGVNVASDTVVSAPLQKHTIEPQSFALFVHVGPYDKLPDTWMAAFEYVQANGIELDPNGWALEQYVSDPMETPEDELITNIFLPLLHDEVGGGAGYNH